MALFWRKIIFLNLFLSIPSFLQVCVFPIVIRPFNPSVRWNVQIIQIGTAMHIYNIFALHRQWGFWDTGCTIHLFTKSLAVTISIFFYKFLNFSRLLKLKQSITRFNRIFFIKPYLLKITFYSMHIFTFHALLINARGRGLIQKRY